ncbi:hypothetical protein P7H90_08330 [Lactococcus lactis]|uniref:hypothetical protein n=1 Tax=Lactococcus lactis TaxID=1358 RepID=UPI00288EEA07|nr:hypothetical protein [Lactococcus lactis]MDT2919287.1 hypothetical protein [Lactococcus lactis]MDT2939204.1 hypothetical protein [Lactococcus lactis]
MTEINIGKIKITGRKTLISSSMIQQKNNVKKTETIVSGSLVCFKATSVEIN